MSIHRLVKRDSTGHIVFFNAKLDSWDRWLESDDDGCYWIDDFEVATRRGLIRFVRHMTEKNWITTKHLRDFIDVSHEIVGKSPFEL